MTVLKVLKFPSDMLKKKAEHVNLINSKIVNIIHDLVDTLFAYDALGIAATQVNLDLRIIIVNMSNNYIEQPFILINPKIVFLKGSTINEEGCLSFPGIFLKVKRYKEIYIKFIDIDSNLHFIKADKMFSVCLQHEIDHINGITMYDKVSNIKKKVILRQMV